MREFQVMMSEVIESLIRFHFCSQLIVVPVYTSLEMFQGTVEGRERARQFKELGCEEIEMYIPDREHNDDCAGLLFSMSSIIHDGAQCK